MTVDVGILGPIEAHRDGEWLNVGGARQRRLLAHLALASTQTRGLDSVVAAMWPDQDGPHNAKASVHTAVSRVRHALGDTSAVVAHSGGYGLQNASVDAALFATLVEIARIDADPWSRAETLRSSLCLWRGAALEEFSHEDWARPDAVRLDELRAHAADEFGQALIVAGRPDDAIAELEAAAARSPIRERTHRVLMDALYQCGRQAEALRTSEAYRHRLATELGLEPGDEIRALAQAIAARTMSSIPTRRKDRQAADEPVLRRFARSYELGEEIGQGSFAVVYRGVQPSVGRAVAVKVIRPELADHPDFIHRFEAEARLVARMEHPFVVPLYDFWREPGSACLVMRLFRGGTLEHRIDKGKLSVDEAVRMTTQIGSALGAAHRCGVVHRDVRPANVMLDDDGNYFLGDFGIATTTAFELTNVAASPGSPVSASPEQLRGEPAGPQSDVFGLGMLLFTALTGSLPFAQAASVADLVRHHLHDPLPSILASRPEFTGAIDTVIGRATAKKARERHGSVAEFVSDVTDALIA